MIYSIKKNKKIEWTKLNNCYIHFLNMNIIIKKKIKQ